MSNPTTNFCVCADVQLADIEEILGVNLLKSNLGVYHSDAEPANVGKIWIYYRTTSCAGFEYYKQKWNLFLNFGSPSSWNQVRMQLVFMLYIELVNKFPGYYMAYIDTGAVLFYSTPEGLFLNEKEEQNMFALPKPKYGDLPVVFKALPLM